MSEPKEDIDLLSQKELEDGELEDGELDEPEIINTIDNESELINTDIHDDSDVSINDKSLKIKKHKHHKKGVHRKRHINSNEKNDNKWKKYKSNDECEDDDRSSGKTDLKNINFDSTTDQIEMPVSEKFKDNSDNVTKLMWGYESEEEQNSSNKYNKSESKQSSFNESYKQKDKILSPVYEPASVENDNNTFKDVEVSKWNEYDSEDEGNTSANTFKNKIKSNSFDEPCNNFRNSKKWDKNFENDNNSWNDKPDFSSNKNWKSNNSPNRTTDDINMPRSPMASDFDSSNIRNNSPTRDKSGWDCGSSLQDDNNISKTSESIPVSPKANKDNFGKWGYESPDESQEETKNWTSSNSPKKSDNWGSCKSPKNNDECPKWGSYDNDNNQKWASNDSPKRNDDNNQKWSSRDDDSNQRWSSRDSPRRNNDDNNQRWGSRDGSRRNNFRRWAPRDGSRRNNNFRRWGSRDGSQRNNGNQRWGSSNNGSPQRNDDNQRWGSSNNTSPPRNNDNKRWGSSNNDSPERDDNNKKWSSNNNSPERNENERGTNNENSKLDAVANQDTYDIPQKSSWGAYDSDDDTAVAPKNPTSQPNQDNTSNKWGSNTSPSQSKPNDKWDIQDSPKGNVVESNSGTGKWGAFDSDEEGNQPTKDNSTSNNKSTWKSYDSEEDKEKFNENENKNENRSRGGYNNSNWNRNDFKNDRGNDWNDRNNDRNKRWNNRNDNEKRNVCKYFSMGSCRHGDRCTYLHESPNNKPVSQEPKKKELCRFYEHQQCYKRSNCSYMHEEFPCKLFHAGSKMCPSGDSCKYSHAPLNQETKALLEKYLDEKVDERTDKNGSEWSSIIKKSVDDDIDDDNAPSVFEQPENYTFPDTIRYRYPGSQDMMRFPRPWSAMMRYGEMPMQVPPQMDFIHRQRFIYDRFQYPVPTGRMFPRSFRGVVPPNMHEGFPNGVPFSMPPVIPGNPKLIPGHPSDIKENFNISDPYIDNLAQLVVCKDPVTSPKRLVDMLDPNMQCEDIDDFSLEIETNSSKKNLASPVVIKSPEIPPGAYVPRTSMNAAQPNVRLGPGAGFGGEQAMLYGGYPSHPSDAMMDYINMSAIHYFHNHSETMGYDLPWKLVLLEVPIKIPYPLMVIETHDLPHKYTDPRLKGHPSVLNSSSSNEESVLHQNSYELNSISNYGSQLQSPTFITTSSESSETLTPLNDFLPKSDEPESPMYPIGEDIFSFKNKIETDEFSKRIGSDRSYLQDPRFKRKKVVNIAVEPSEME